MGLLICNDFEVEKDVWSDIVNGLRGFHGQSIRFVWCQLVYNHPLIGVTLRGLHLRSFRQYHKQCMV